MKFSLFRKPKQKTEQEKPTAPSQEEPKEQATPVTEEPMQEPASPMQPQEAQESVTEPQQTQLEAPETQNKTYLKAMPLKELTDIESVENEVKNGNIVILKVTPLANKSIDDVKNAVNQLYAFSESIGGDIARLGEERVVICPKNIRIWREKTPASNEPLPTAA